MAVTLVTGINRYEGLSSDTKPTTGVPVGSTFWETDTGDTYKYNGSGWAAAPADVKVTGSIPAELTWGAVNGYGDGLLDGTLDDWYAVRNAVDVDATDILNTQANVLKYFDSDHASFNATAIWIKIPVMAAADGWRTFSATVRNGLGLNLTIDAYAVPIKGFIFETAHTITDAASYLQMVAAQVVADGDNLTFGPGGVTFTNVCQWPIGWLVIKATPAGNPAANKSWRLAVVRAK